MKITDVRVILASPHEYPLLAYASLVLENCFAVHDLRVLTKGDRLFVSMPNRRRHLNCPGCQGKNPNQARFCCHCGQTIPLAVVTKLPSATTKVFTDIAHPINAQFRQQLETEILQHYQQCVTRAEVPRGEAG